MFIFLFLSLAVHAAPTEKNLIKTFDKAQAVYKRFQSDTMKYRADTESYNEQEFEPAVERMISLLGDKKCKKCVLSYLKGLSHLGGSASEMLTDQLKRIIAKYPESLDEGCKKLDAAARKNLSTFFSDAITFLSQEQKVERKSLEKGLRSCL